MSLGGCALVAMAAAYVDAVALVALSVAHFV
jgi:hypothetical protein